MGKVYTIERIREIKQDKDMKILVDNLEKDIKESDNLLHNILEDIFREK